MIRFNTFELSVFLVEVLPNVTISSQGKSTERAEKMGPSGGMVDAGDSKSPAARRAGSSPALGTKSKQTKAVFQELTY